MAYEKAIINKETLAFLLSQKGVTNEYLSQKAACTVKQIVEWTNLDNDKLPTVNQARKIAEALRVPFASLYMTLGTITPFIPTKPIIQNRRIMDADNQDDSAVNLAIIDLIQARDFYVETEELLQREVKQFTIQINLDANVESWANEIRNKFEIDLERQYKAPSSRQFYLYLKNRIEDQGIFIQEFLGVDLDSLRAMAIYQDSTIMPVIGINEKDRPPAKCFSLIHELVHITKRSSSICNAMYDNSFLKNQEEIFCNAVSGELLVPQIAINTIIKNGNYDLTDLADIQRISDKFSISREVIIRRLLDLNYIQNSDYDILSKLLHDELIASKEEQRLLKESGIQLSFSINPAQKAMDKTSMSLSKAIYAGYCEDIFTKYDVAQILSIKTKHIDKYFMEVTKWDN